VNQPSLWRGFWSPQKGEKRQKLAKKGDYFAPSNRHFVRVFPAFSAQKREICARFAVAL
jgi:hypothetical protein